MTDPARGPTTEELRARVLAAEMRCGKCGHRRSLHHLAGVEDGGCGATSPVLLSPCHCDRFAPPLDSEGAERQ